MNDLLQYFETSDHRLIHKWIHYFEIYDRHFARFRGTDVCIVEIGIYHGGSLQMWRNYFGANAKIIGIDIDPRCKDLEEEGIEIIIGNQEDREFLRSLKEKIPHIDILLDDGGHTMNQQIVTFEELFSHVDQNGVYLCEDLHTSYWGEYEGGFRKPSSFVEYSKDLIDSLNAWHSRDSESFPINHFTRSAYSMSFYGSVLVIEKQAMSPPCDRMIGDPSFDSDEMIQIMQKIEVGQPLQSELYAGSKDWQGRYAELNSRFFQIFEEHQKLHHYVRDLQKALEQTQQHYQQAQQAYQQTQQEHQHIQQQLQEERQQSHQQLQEAHLHLQNTQAELSQTQTHLQTIKAELEQCQALIASQSNQLQYQLELQSQLESFQLQLLQTENDLIEVQQDREVQRFRAERFQHKFEQVRDKLQQVRERFQRSKTNLENKRLELEDAHRELAAMKTSKFWKLRSGWIGIRKSLGIKGD